MPAGTLFTFLQLQVAFTLFTSFFQNPAPATTSTFNCRSRPGDSLFPTVDELLRFNESVDGRLVPVIPSSAYCASRGGCTDAEWSSSMFRSTIPGAMTNVNWEQNYHSDPNSQCSRNNSGCGADLNVPAFAVNASGPEDIQSGIRFARTHNLKLVVKSTGHDFLGRSTAKNSFLLWTRNLRNITFHDSFQVGGRDMGSAVTVGAGVPLNMLYKATKANGKTFVGGAAATVAPAGGYVQGAGHSALSPKYGMAADNVLEFHVVLANGDLVTANAISHPDLFWALRGGGAGSWGVVVNATFRTFPRFNAAHQRLVIVVNTTVDVRALSEIHAQHVFDWDDAQAAQYFYLRTSHHDDGVPKYTFTIDTVLPELSVDESKLLMQPLMQDFLERGFAFTTSYAGADINDILTVPTDLVGNEFVMTSRFWSDDVYRNNISDIGRVYQDLLDGGANCVLGHRVLGGQVSKNADIESAVHPGWRTAKTHMIVTRTWTNTSSSEDIELLRKDLTQNKTPVLASLAGPDGGSYSNEGDVQELDFRRTFYGPHYAHLSSVKAQYDPQDLFIVPTGVGSERWDADGFCKTTLV